MNSPLLLTYKSPELIELKVDNQDVLSYTNSIINREDNMNTQTVRIFEGSYRGHAIENLEFPMVKPLTSGANGHFVTVDGSAHAGFPAKKIRVKVPTAESIELLGETEMTAKPEVAEKPADDEARMAQIKDRFQILEDMTDAACEGVVRGMIVSGPPGVGKSFGVENKLEEYAMLDKIGGMPLKYEVVKGAMTPIGLYCLLYNNSDKGKVLVLDDCDSVLFDELSLNILKGALDSGKKRKIYWNADSSKLRSEGIPDNFEFKGSIIFITNLKFDKMTQGGRLGKIKDHLEAIISRCHYLDLTLDTMRDKMLRIKQIVGDGMLNDYAFTTEQHNEVINFINDEKHNLREVSLRMVLKVADLYKMYKGEPRWKTIAYATCCKRLVA